MLSAIVAQRYCGMISSMTQPPITLYGIPNCDTVKKARLWLDAHGRQYRFHDFKREGVPPQLLDRWLDALGWEALVNRKGTMWRKLDEAARAAVVDRASARALLLALSSIIKRPVVEWSGNSPDSVTVGFKPAAWLARVPNH